MAASSLAGLPEKHIRTLLLPSFLAVIDVPVLNVPCESSRHLTWQPFRLSYELVMYAMFILYDSGIGYNVWLPGRLTYLRACRWPGTGPRPGAASP